MFTLNFMKICPINIVSTLLSACVCLGRCRIVYTHEKEHFIINSRLCLAYQWCLLTYVLKKLASPRNTTTTEVSVSHSKLLEICTNFALENSLRQLRLALFCGSRFSLLYFSFTSIYKWPISFIPSFFLHLFSAVSHSLNLFFISYCFPPSSFPPLYLTSRSFLFLYYPSSVLSTSYTFFS
jgi:hypothetical protein